MVTAQAVCRKAASVGFRDGYALSCRTAVLLTALLAAAPALAMETDDQGTVAPKAVEIEILAVRSTFPDLSEGALRIAATTGTLGNLDIGIALPCISSIPMRATGRAAAAAAASASRTPRRTGTSSRP